jgi:hypothetical protein
VSFDAQALDEAETVFVRKTYVDDNERGPKLRDCVARLPSRRGLRNRKALVLSAIATRSLMSRSSSTTRIGVGPLTY